MGMYDSINFRLRCPLCKSEMGEFQSKDNECQLNILSPTAVEEFYTSCDTCNLWITFLVEKAVIDNQHVYVITPSYMDMQAVNKNLLEKWTAPEWRRKRDEEQELRNHQKFNRRYTDRIVKGRKLYGS